MPRESISMVQSRRSSVGACTPRACSCSLRRRGLPVSPESPDRGGEVPLPQKKLRSSKQARVRRGPISSARLRFQWKSLRIVRPDHRVDAASRGGCLLPILFYLFVYLLKIFYLSTLLHSDPFTRHSRPESRTATLIASYSATLSAYRNVGFTCYVCTQ